MPVDTEFAARAREDFGFLASLPVETQDLLIENPVFRVVPPGEELMVQGQPSNGLALILSGLLEIRDGDRRVGWRTRGDLVGVTPLLTGEPPTRTVTVRRHAVVLTIEQDLCERYLLTHASVTAALAATRLGQSEDTWQRRPGAFVYAVVAAGGLPDADVVEATFAKAALASKLTAFLSRTEAQWKAGAFGGGMSVSLAEWLHDRESSADVTVLFATDPDDVWGAACRARADHVLALVPRKMEPYHHEQLCRIRESARSFAIAIVSGNTAETPGEENREDLSGLPVLVIDASDVDEISMGLDNLLESQANPGWLRRFEVFSSLTEHELELVFEDVTWQPVAGGEVLLEEGCAGGDVFLVDAGRFQAFRATAAGEEILAEIGPGEIFGETTALTNPVLWASVRALRDSYVGRIPGERFRALLEEVPSMARGLSFGLAKRHRELAPLTVAGPPKNIVVVPLTGSEAALSCGNSLADTMSSLGLDFFAVDPTVIDGQLFEGASEVANEGPRGGAVENWLHRLEDDHEVVLLIADDRDSVWTRRCLRQADAVVLVGDGDADPGLREVERPLFGDPGALRSPHLVLLQPAGVIEARGTQRWLEDRPGVVHHHVRAGNRRDLCRVVRRILKRAVGIAFSGASSRGVAHLGVARGLRDHGLPLDLTSGSSSGAAVAGLMVTGMSHDEMMAHAQRVLAGVGLKAARLQPPLTSLMSGKAFEFFLKGVLGDRRLEDQMLGCTLTAVDLNRHQLVGLRTGPIWLAARASMSLPFFWPPVWFEEHLLVH